jgi:hypothetical protein
MVVDPDGNETLWSTHELDETPDAPARSDGVIAIDDVTTRIANATVARSRRRWG